RVYLKPTSLDKYRDKLKPGTFSNKVDPAGPHFYFQYAGDIEKEIADFNVQNKINLDQEVPGTVDKERDWFSGAFQLLLPVGLFILLWILLMRKMGGGGGSGGPGGIFNIGKSKATLFDKGTKVSIT